MDDRGRRPSGRPGRGRRRAARTTRAGGTDDPRRIRRRTSSPPGRPGQILAPWPNRIRDGHYTFEGSAYQLPLTEPARHNAIHGLANWSRWRLVEQTADVGDAGVRPAAAGRLPVVAAAAHPLDGLGRRAARRPGGRPTPATANAPFGLLRAPVPAAARRRRSTTSLLQRARPAAGCWPTPGCCRSARSRWPAASTTSPSPGGSATPVLDTTFGDIDHDADGGSSVTHRRAGGAARGQVWADASVQVVAGLHRRHAARRAAPPVGGDRADDLPAGRVPLGPRPDRARAGRDLVGPSLGHPAVGGLSTWSSTRSSAGGGWSATTTRTGRCRRELVDKLLGHALRAPSAGFSQGWGFLVLDEPADRDAFWAATTPRRRPASGAAAGWSGCAGRR